MGKLLRVLVKVSAFITVGVLVSLIAYILIMGIPNLTLEMFEWEYTIKNCSVVPALVNTLIMVVTTLLIVVPIGVGSAIYLVEYAKKDSIMVKLVSMTSETLAGIPSIIYGLFGALFFSEVLGFGYSMISGTFTLAIMTLPSVMRTTQEALMSVPDIYREGSYGLGAGKLRTIFKVVLPPAMNGIIAGIILAIGRMVGETAALIFTAGTVAKIPGSLFDSGRTLAVHMYQLFNEGRAMENGYATGVILIILVLIINGISNFIGKRIEGDNDGR